MDLDIQIKPKEEIEEVEDTFDDNETTEFFPEYAPIVTLGTENAGPVPEEEREDGNESNSNEFVDSRMDEYEEVKDLTSVVKRRPIKSYPLSFKLDVIEFAEKTNNSAASRRFNVHARCIRDWRKQKDAIQTVAECSTGRKRVTGNGEETEKRPYTRKRPRRAQKAKNTRSSYSNDDDAPLINYDESYDELGDVLGNEDEFINLAQIQGGMELKHHRSYPLSFKLEAIAFAEQTNNTNAARKFNVDTKCIRMWRARKEEIRELSENDGSRKRVSGAGRKPSKVEKEKPPNQRPRQSYGLSFKLEAVSYSEQHSAEAAASHYGVDSRRIREWKQQKDLLEQRRAEEGPTSVYRKRKKNPEMDNSEAKRSNPKSITFLHQFFHLTTVNMYKYNSKKILWNSVFPPNAVLTFPSVVSLSLPKYLDKSWKLYRLGRYFPSIKRVVFQQLNTYQIMAYFPEVWGNLESLEVFLDAWDPDLDHVITGLPPSRCKELVEIGVGPATPIETAQTPSLSGLVNLRELKISVEPNRSVPEGKSAEEGKSGLTDLSIYFALLNMKTLETLTIPENEFTECGKAALVKGLNLKSVELGESRRPPEETFTLNVALPPPQQIQKEIQQVNVKPVVMTEHREHTTPVMIQANHSNNATPTPTTVHQPMLTLYPSTQDWSISVNNLQNNLQQQMPQAHHHHHMPTSTALYAHQWM